MFDLHCHLLPGIDDGSASLEMSCAMAEAYVSQGVMAVACTPHILPGLYHNTGAEILQHVATLTLALNDRGIGLTVVAGADNHIVPTFVPDLKRGHLLPIAGSRYVLVEPPHHVVPDRVEDLFFQILSAGYVPILTHPERLTWIEAKYDLVCTLHDRGVWMQVTSGSLVGRFGRRAKYWADRMVCEGRCELLASDAHDTERRPPDLERGRRTAEQLIGADAAQDLVVSVPQGVLEDRDPAAILSGRAGNFEIGVSSYETMVGHRDDRGWVDRLRRLIS